MKTEEQIMRMVRQVIHEVNEVPTDQRKHLVFAIEREIGGVEVTESIRTYKLVYLTTDLTMFKDIPGNRVINENSKEIKKLADSIREVGVRVPILINEQNQVIDGQRRLAAIRRHGLGTPVPFHYDEHADINIVSTSNRFNLRWNYKDWLHSYVVGEKQDYIDYAKLAEKYEKFMRSRSLRGLLMNGKVDALSLDIWEGGGFKINRELLKTNVDFLEVLKRVFEFGGRDNMFAKDRDFQKALYDVYRKTKNIDVERLIYKIRYGYNRLNIKSDFKGYKKILGELYNVRLPADMSHAITEDLPEDKKENHDAENNNETEPKLSL